MRVRFPLPATKIMVSMMHNRLKGHICPTGNMAHVHLGPNGVQRIDLSRDDDRTHCLIRSMIRENYPQWPEELQSGITYSVMKLLKNTAVASDPWIYKMQAAIHYFKMDHMLSHWPRGQRKFLIEPLVTTVFENLRDEQLAQKVADNLASVANDEAAMVATDLFQSFFL
jgi:hypothetical protein